MLKLTTTTENLNRVMQDLENRQNLLNEQRLEWCLVKTIQILKEECPVDVSIKLSGNFQDNYNDMNCAIDEGLLLELGDKINYILNIPLVHDLLNLQEEETFIFENNQKGYEYLGKFLLKDKSELWFKYQFSVEIKDRLENTLDTNPQKSNRPKV